MTLRSKKPRAHHAHWADRTFAGPWIFGGIGLCGVDPATIGEDTAVTCKRCLRLLELQFARIAETPPDQD